MTRNRPLSADAPALRRRVDDTIALSAADRALRRALRLTIGPLGLSDTPAGAWRSMRPAIHAFAAAYRACGAAPETTLVAFKRVMCDAVPSLVGIRITTDSDAESEAVTTLIRWCIEDYYHTEPVVAERHAAAPPS